MPDLGIYFHLPFCLSRCGYCDFAVVTDRDDAQGDYVECLETEIDYWGSRIETPPVSVYFGGGTPSRLRSDLWRRLVHRLCETVPIHPGIEITCEANPESADSGVLALWRDLGVNRISLGVQTFDPQSLQDLDRRHDPQGALDAIDRVRKAGFENWSFDLIYGLPGQTLEQWRQDLVAVLSLSPPHLSFYNLILHPGLPVTGKALRAAAPDSDEVQSDMFLLAVETLEANGYEVYELSNAARPGLRCRHNELYWRGGDWIGLGMSGSSHFQGGYFGNPRSWAAYLETWETRPADLPVQWKSSEPDAGILDFVMLRLRTAEGFSLEELEAATGKPRTEAFSRLLFQMREEGYTRGEADRVALSPKGWLVHSEITTRILESIG